MNSLGGSVRVSGVAEIVSRTEEWSEFRSRILTVEQCKLLGILAAKMSRMSGFLFGAVGQYVGPGGGKNIDVPFVCKVVKNNTTRVVDAATPALMFCVVIATDNKISFNCAKIIVKYCSSYFVSRGGGVECTDSDWDFVQFN